MADIKSNQYNAENKNQIVYNEEEFNFTDKDDARRPPPKTVMDTKNAKKNTKSESNTVANPTSDSPVEAEGSDQPSADVVNPINKFFASYGKYMIVFAVLIVVVIVIIWIVFMKNAKPRKVKADSRIPNISQSGVPPPVNTPPVNPSHTNQMIDNTARVPSTQPTSPQSVSQSTQQQAPVNKNTAETSTESVAKPYVIPTPQQVVNSSSIEQDAQQYAREKLMRKKRENIVIEDSEDEEETVVEPTKVETPKSETPKSETSKSETPKSETVENTKPESPRPSVTTPKVEIVTDNDLDNLNIYSDEEK